MIPLHIDKIKNIQSSFKTEIEEQRRSALKKLQNIDRTLFNRDEQKFINDVIAEFQDKSFLVKNPSEINLIQKKLGSIENFNNGNLLSREIQKALNFRLLRNKFYPKYFRKLGIKTCVYCNSQLAITIIKNNTNKIDARFEVDHYESKNDFPYLSISLFNLYPCCSSCNKRKGTKKLNFQLYTDEISKLTTSEYKFEITKSSKCYYLLTKDVEAIRINFNDTSSQIAGHKSLQDAFSIKEIHDTQKDIVAELIIKNQIYNVSFKDTLKKSFSKLSLSQKDFDRVIVGNYTNDKDIHKRPFSKMTMDIAKQLGLIE